MSRVIHFEVPVDDPTRAVKFYQDALGWDIQKWDGGDYWLVSTGPNDQPGINGGLTPRQRDGIASTTVNTLDVADLDASVAKVTAAGGKVLAPRMPVPGIGYLAYCADTEGNAFGLMQADSSAK